MLQLHGLVICGGQSTRMGRDKGLIAYHGKPQWLQAADMLRLLCNDVLICCNKAQVTGYSGTYPVLVDYPEYEQIGPMGALLSAFKMHPGSSFLVLGCDYPLVTKEELQQLMDSRRPGADAVCFYYPEEKTEEPLVAVYEAIMLNTLNELFCRSDFSLRHALQCSKTYRIPVSASGRLQCVDTPEEARQMHLILRSASPITSLQEG